MNARIVRKNSVANVSESAASSAFSQRAVLERLRRIIFSSARRRAGTLVVALAAALAGTSAAFAQTPLVFDPTADMTVGVGNVLTIYNDLRDLQNPNNDPSKTITLDGGVFVYDSEIVGLLGTDIPFKGWAWGDDGGTISVGNLPLVLRKTLGYSDEMGNDKAISLTKDGGGDLILTNDIGVSYLDNLTINDGSVTFLGKLNLGAESSDENYSKIKLTDSPLVVYPESRIDFYEGLNSPNYAINTDLNNAVGGIQIDKGKIVEICGSERSFVITRDTNFNSEGKISIFGNVGIHTDSSQGNNNPLSLSLYDVDIFSNGQNDPKLLKLAVCTLNSESSEAGVNENGIIKLTGTINIDGGDEKNGLRPTTVDEAGNEVEIPNAELRVTGKTIISGTLDNRNGGQATFNDHVTIVGQYYSKSENPYKVNEKDKGIHIERASDYFRNGLTITENGEFIAKDFGIGAGGTLEVKENGSALIYGTSLFESKADGERATILLSGNGLLVGTCENIDAPTYFDNGGRLVLGNYNDLTDGTISNPYMITEDEYGRSTLLKMSFLRDTVVTFTREEARNQSDYIHGAKVAGNGEIEIFSPVGYSETGDDVTTYVALMSGDKTEFTGNTEVRLGSLALYCFPETGTTADRRSFQYGSSDLTQNTGVFNVYGETLGSKEGDEIVDYGTSGQLVFWRPNVSAIMDKEGRIGTATLDDAPILYASQVNFKAGDKGEEKGAKLFFNTFFKERVYDSEGNYSERALNEEARNLGSICANEINFSSNNYVWYESVSNLSPSATMTITLDAPEITIDGAKIDVSNSSELADLFGKPLVSTTATQIDGGGFKIEGSAQTVASYASAQGMTKKERNYAAKIDANRLAGNDLDYYDALYNETDPNKVRQTIHNLSLGGYQMLNAYGHFGNPTSSFFGGSAISGEHKRAQSYDPDYSDSNNDGGQGDQSNYGYQQSAIAQNGSYGGGDPAIWGAYTNTTVVGSEYDDDGITMNGYRLRRQGVIGGVKRQIDGSTSSGLFFGLSTPEIYSSGKIQGYGNYGSRMEMDDFQFAGHFEKVFGDFWEFAAYVGGGTQSMDWSRTVSLNDGGLYRFNAKGTGNTLTGTLYLANRIDLSENLTFRPMIGVDSEHSWLYGFGEDQTSGGSVNDVDAYMRWLAQPYFYDKTYYNRNTARAGARVNWTGSAGYAGLNAQAFYGVQLGGKDAPSLSYRSASYAFDDMETHAMGGESLSVGGGGFVNLNRAKTLTATGDFNVVWYKHATTQNVVGGLSYRF